MKRNNVCPVVDTSVLDAHRGTSCTATQPELSDFIQVPTVTFGLRSDRDSLPTYSGAASIDDKYYACAR